VKHKVGPEHVESRLLRKELSVSLEEAIRRAVEPTESAEVLHDKSFF